MWRSVCGDLSREKGWCVGVWSGACCSTYTQVHAATLGCCFSLYTLHAAASLHTYLCHPCGFVSQVCLCVALHSANKW